MSARSRADGAVDKLTALKDDNLAKLKKVVNIALLALLVWFLASHQETIRSNVKGRDSTLYWATAKLLVHRGNPYSIPEVLALEWSEHRVIAGRKPTMYRPPPWSLWMIAPLGWLSAYWSWIAWSTIALIALVIDVRLCWRLYGDEPSPPTIFLLVAYLFAPVVACLVMAQMGTVLLLGVVVFFVLVEKRPFLAGMALLLPIAKPHFFAPLWFALLIWIVTRRKWSVLAGMLTAFVIANVFAIALDPAIFSHYREMLQLDQMQNEFMPNLSGVMRAIFFRQHYAAQFVPAILGMGWAAHFYWKRRERWNWGQHGPWLLVVGALVAPYSWMMDEVVVLPAVLQGVIWIGSRKLRLRSQFAMVIFVLLDLLLLLIVKEKVDFFTGIYFLRSVVWVLW